MAEWCVMPPCLGLCESNTHLQKCMLIPVIGRQHFLTLAMGWVVFDAAADHGSCGICENSGTHWTSSNNVTIYCLPPMRKALHVKRRLVCVCVGGNQARFICGLSLVSSPSESRMFQVPGEIIQTQPLNIGLLLQNRTCSVLNAWTLLPYIRVSRNLVSRVVSPPRLAWSL